MDVVHERTRPVVGFGQYDVHEEQVAAPQEDSRCQDRRDHLEETDAACLERGDLVIGRKPAEGHEAGDQHGHGDRYGDDPGQVEKKYLEHDEQVEVLADDEVGDLKYDVHHEDERDDHEGEQKGTDVRLEHVSVEVNREGHGPIGRITGRGRAFRRVRCRVPSTIVTMFLKGPSTIRI